MAEKVKKAIILMNLGSPDSVKVKDVSNYLKEFLMDERVIDSPWLWRSILVKGIITPFRSPKSAEAYASIWTAEGSPLVAITFKQQKALQKLVKEPVEVSMRYGKPTMKSTYDKLHSAYPDLEEIVLMPLYPHYAMSSYETAVVHAKDVHSAGKYPFRIKFVEPFYNDPGFIDALAESIRPSLANNAHLLFSYHSIPERHIHKSDVTGNHCLKMANCCEVDSPAHQFCYRHQCFITSKLVVERLGIKPGGYSIAFQSKLGRAEWLKPSTTKRMDELPKEGIKNLAVVCPSFVSDCLETLEEIGIREKENFIKAGGESFTFIPCMNTNSDWIKAMAVLVSK